MTAVHFYYAGGKYGGGDGRERRMFQDWLNNLYVEAAPMGFHLTELLGQEPQKYSCFFISEPSVIVVCIYK